MNSLPLPPTLFWPLLGVCVLVFAMLWWVMLGSGRFVRRRLLRRRINAFGPAQTPSQHAALDGMQQAIAGSREALSHPSATQAVREPLYRIPWFLFIGDAEADVPGLLAAAAGASAVPPPLGRDARGIAFWRWWFLGSMTAIETGPAAVSAAEVQSERRLWFHALMALSEQRERLPLNGIVACVSASSLLGDAAASAATAGRLRRVVEEAAEYLRLQLPVYVVVTGLERLAGYAVLRAALPPEVLAQALGHRLSENGGAGGAAGARLDELFDSIALRLHALRMGLLSEQHDPKARQGIHFFVEEVCALQAGLRMLVERMFENSRGRRPPRWRGLYFSAAPSEYGDGAFVADLFQHFLPIDQPLAKS